MKSSYKTLALMMLLCMGVLLPNIFVIADGNNDPVRISQSLVEFNDYSKPMPNGYVKVYWKIKMNWHYEGEVIGYAWQYVIGYIDLNNIADLYGIGVFTSTIEELPGQLRYFIANKWNLNTNEIYDFRMNVFGGTGSFKGVRGIVEADGLDWLMYLNSNPWD